MAYNPAEDTYANQTAAREAYFKRQSLLDEMDEPGPAAAPDGPLPPSPSPINSAGPVATAPLGPSPAAPSQSAPPLSPALQTYANQTPAREAYAARNRGTIPQIGAGASTPAPASPAYSEQAVRNEWAASPDHSPAALARLAAKYGLQANGDTIILPDGRKIDAVMDEGSANNPGWIDTSVRGGVSRGSTGADRVGVAGAGGSVGSSFAGAGGGDATGGGVAAGAGSAPGVDPELQAAVRAQLLRLMGQSDKPIDVNADPRAQAYRGARQRGAGNERAALAERAAFTGLNPGGQGSGAFETGVQGIQEGASEDIAGYEAGLVGEEVQARRGQLMQALDLANAVGARTEALALQRELANMDNKYRYSALGENSRQFTESSDFSWTQLEALLNRQAYLDALGQGA